MQRETVQDVTVRASAPAYEALVIEVDRLRTLIPNQGVVRSRASRSPEQR